jgi:hypothetical protein
MPPIHRTYCDFHLGDNLVHLHFLRALAARHPDHLFIHAVHECHLGQLREFVEDLPAIRLCRIEDKAPEAINAWKNAGGFFERHPRRDDWCEMHLEWFCFLAGKIGLESPFRAIHDLRLDAPAIHKRLGPALSNRYWDFLVVNSRPCSGQLPAYDRVEYFDPLLAELAGRGYRVLVTQETEVPGVDCTASHGLSLAGIANCSLRCIHHVMVSTGPSWAVLNADNIPSRNTRILLIGRERLNYDGLKHAASLDECRAILRERGLL